MLPALIALSLAASARTFDWASATAELELLQGLSPAASDAPKSPFVKLGGSCWQPGADGKVKLGDGKTAVHAWQWTLEVRVAKNAVTLTGPNVKHSVNSLTDKRKFDDKGAARTLGIGPGVRDVWPLYSELHQLELRCGQVDEASAFCGGKQKTCKRCATLQLMGGPHPGLHNYAQGLAQKPVETTCENLCEGPGLSWPDYEALAALVNRTAFVVDASVPPVAQMFRTRAACEAAKADLDASFKPVEPDVPPR